MINPSYFARLVAACLLALTPALGQAQVLSTYILPTCPVTHVPPVQGGQKAAAIVGLIVQQIISKGVDMAGAALNEAAKDKVTSLTSDTEPAPYYTMDTNAGLKVSAGVGCLVMVAGGQDSVSAAPNQRWVSKVLAASAGDQQRKLATSTPSFYAELQLSDNNNLGLTVTPMFLYVGERFAKGSFFTRSSSSDYVLSLSFIDEGTGTPFGAVALPFKQIAEGKAMVRRLGLDPNLDLIMGTAWPTAARIPKLPQGEDIKEAQAGQKSAIAPFKEANAALKKVVQAPPVVKDPLEGRDDYKLGVDALCKAIAAANARDRDRGTDKGQPAAPKLSDPRCPYEVWQARLNVEKVTTAATAAIDLDWAKAVYASCASESKTATTTVATLTRGTQTVNICALPKPEDAGVGLFSVSSTVVETTEASKFIKALAASFSEKKDSLKTELNDRINPVRKAELAAAQTSSERDARQKYQIASLKVSKAEAVLTEAAGLSASARKAAEIDLTLARIEANAAARAAGEAPPWPEND